MNLNKIAIHGVPRSGTTWLGAIFDSSEEVIYRNQPLFSYEFKSYLDTMSSKNDIHEFFKKISQSNDEFITQKESKDKGFIPSFIKSTPKHIVYKEARYHNILNNVLEQDKDVKIVGIIRDPRSVIFSWNNAPKEFNKKDWDLLQEWEKADLKNKGNKEEYYGYLKWKEMALMFLDFKKVYSNQFYLLEYNDLLTNTIEIVIELFSFCGIEYGKQTQSFILDSKSKDMSQEAYSVYRTNKADNKWQGLLPNNIVKTIEKDLKGTPLEIFLNKHD